MKVKSLKYNAILNVIKTLISLIFPLITFPYVSRVLQAENYGKLNFSNSIVSYFSLIAALGIFNYAVREGARLREKKEELNKFCSQIFSINIITTIIAYILLIILLIMWRKLDDYRILVLVQSLSIAFSTIGVSWIYSIYEDYAYITIQSIITQIVSLILLFMFVHRQEDYIVYAFICVIAGAGGNIFNLIHSKKYINLHLTTKLELAKNIKPLMILFANSLAMTIYINSDTTILGALNGDTAVGTYSAAAKIYNIIKQILNALIIVSLPRLSVLLGKNEYRRYNELLNKIFKALLTILMPAIIGLFMLSKQIIVLVGGQQYVNGYISLKILSISLGFAVLACFFTNTVLLPYKRDKYFLYATLISASVNLVLNFIFIPLLGQDGAALTTVIAEFLVFVIALYCGKEYFEINNLSKTIMSSGIGCGIIVFICILAQKICNGYIEIIIVSIFFSGVVYSIVMIVLKNEIVIGMIDSIRILIKNKRNKHI